MGRQPWANVEQRAFLKSESQSFLDAQEKKQLTRFWDKINQQWFEKFPEPKPSSGDEAADLKAYGARIDRRKKVSRHPTRL